jgi:hypothetical protein
VVLPIVDSLQLPAAAAGGFSLFDPLHLALADVEPVSLHRGEHVSLEVLLEPPDCSFELAAWVTAFPVGVPVLPAKVAALIIVALSGHL